jgi:hypothetical protein
MAKEVGMFLYNADQFKINHGYRDVDIETVEKFAALVAAAEREACAKVCDYYAGPFNAHRIGECADAIRARGIDAA